MTRPSVPTATAIAPGPHRLRARRMGMDTQYEAVVFMHKDCPVCRSEGFTAHNRVQLRVGERHIIATLYHVTTDLPALDEAALSEPAWKRLGLQGGETITVRHPDPVESLSHVRGRIYGNELSEGALKAIIGDVVAGKYSDIHLSSFITSCAARPLDRGEILSLTKAMIEAGESLSWQRDIVVDKHSVGGLPGNRTTPIIVPIVAALGLAMPKLQAGVAALEQVRVPAIAPRCIPSEVVPPWTSTLPSRSAPTFSTNQFGH